MPKALKSAEFLHFDGTAGKCKKGQKLSRKVANRFMDGVTELADKLGICLSAGFELSNKETPSWE